MRSPNSPRVRPAGVGRSSRSSSAERSSEERWLGMVSSFVVDHTVATTLHKN
jgi:hypothetical protein